MTYRFPLLPYGEVANPGVLSELNSMGALGVAKVEVAVCLYLYQVPVNEQDNDRRNCRVAQFGSHPVMTVRTIRASVV